MSIDPNFIIGGAVGLALGIIMMVTASLSKPSKVKPSTSGKGKERTIDDRVAPFIEAHLSHMLKKEKHNNDSTVDRLKEKTDSFRLRNRFYRVEN